MSWSSWCTSFDQPGKFLLKEKQERKILLIKWHDTWPAGCVLHVALLHAIMLPKVVQLQGLCMMHRCALPMQTPMCIRACTCCSQGAQPEAYLLHLTQVVSGVLHLKLDLPLLHRTCEIPGTRCVFGLSHHPADSPAKEACAVFCGL